MTNIDKITEIWAEWKDEEQTRWVVGIDPGWEGGCAILDDAGRFVRVFGWRHRVWQSVVDMINETMRDFGQDQRVFAAIEGTHHFGKATLDDIDGLNRRIGMWIQAVKSFNQSYVGCINPIKKIGVKEINAKYHAYGLGGDVVATTQHESDACEIGQKMWRILTSAVEPKNIIKGKKIGAKRRVSSRISKPSVRRRGWF